MENNFNSSFSKDYVLQDYNLIYDNSLQHKIHNCLGVGYGKKLKNILNNNYLNTNTFNEFSYLRSLDFITFFKMNMVDIPDCFGDVKSLRRFNNTIFLIRFTNYLMRNGKRMFLYNKLITALNHILIKDKLKINMENTNL